MSGDKAYYRGRHGHYAPTPVLTDALRNEADENYLRTLWYAMEENAL